MLVLEDLIKEPQTDSRWKNDQSFFLRI
uniref:Uncharacterized protein n=2 Tax=Anguilla anguilla TaxID=7936 RepID=A0A0E9UA21_ANGAN